MRGPPPWVRFFTVAPPARLGFVALKRLFQDSVPQKAPFLRLSSRNLTCDRACGAGPCAATVLASLRKKPLRPRLGFVFSPQFRPCALGSLRKKALSGFWFCKKRLFFAFSAELLPPRILVGRRHARPRFWVRFFTAPPPARLGFVALERLFQDSGSAKNAFPSPFAPAAVCRSHTVGVLKLSLERRSPPAKPGR
jgi:hypothetical protein